MNWSRIFIVFISFIFAGSIACTSDSTQVEDKTSSYLIGRWDIQQASRNGKPTESLDELYFEFFEDGAMRTNLTGATQSGTYSLTEKVIQQRETQMDADYNIEEISDTTLTINTTLKGQVFKFYLHKSQLEE